MGIYDRDYYRNQPRSGFGTFGMWTITTWVIVINVAVFFVDGAAKRRAMMTRGRDYEQWVDEDREINWNLGQGPLEKAGYFSVEKAVYRGQIWRLMTFQFLHASPAHLLFNMFGLFFFGPVVEGQLGARRYLAFYLLCGMAGAVMYLLLWTSGILIGSAAVPMVGASAGIFGVLMAAAQIAPDMQINLWFPPIPIPLRVLAWIMIGMAAYAVMTSGMNAGGEAAHIGGGLLGFVLIRNQHWLNFATPARQTVRTQRRGRRGGVIQKNWSRDFNR